VPLNRTPAPDIRVAVVVRGHAIFLELENTLQQNANNEQRHERGKGISGDGDDDDDDGDDGDGHDDDDVHDGDDDDDGNETQALTGRRPSETG
jgi:hypothetical protein